MSEGLEQNEFPHPDADSDEPKKKIRFWDCCGELEPKFMAVEGEASILFVHRCGKCSCCEAGRCPNKFKKVFAATSAKKKKSKK